MLISVLNEAETCTTSAGSVMTNFWPIQGNKSSFSRFRILLHCVLALLRHSFSKTLALLNNGRWKLKKKKNWAEEAWDCYVFCFPISVQLFLSYFVFLLCQTTSCRVPLLCDWLPRPSVLHLCLVVVPLPVYLVCALPALSASLSLSQVFQQSFPPVCLLGCLFFLFFSGLWLVFLDSASPLLPVCLGWLTSCGPNLPGYKRLEPD